MASPVHAADSDAAATVVVFNEQDALSVDLAGYYAEKRGIPFDHLIGLNCPPEETVSRADYEKRIAGPLREAFFARGWWKTEADIQGARVDRSTIRYVALMRGVPLRIGPVATWEGDRPLPTNSPLNHNEAAVDSELAVLGMQSRQVSGPVENPVFKKPLAEVPWLLRVCRLDAAEASTVKQMIDDALAAEKNGLWGFAYVDSRGMNGGPMGEGDQWFRTAAADISAHGMPCVLDEGGDVFPEHYPLTRMALYLGWYSGQVAGAFQDPAALRFVPGAVAVHLHSFSATSLRAPLQGWCAPLLERGAAATLGNVYEPYLMLTPHLDLFEARLRAGDNFAQAAYGAQAGLSWMTTFVGDPLYRPFKAWQTAAAPADYAVYRAGAEEWAAKGRSAGEAVLQAKGRALKSGLIFEGLGCLQLAAKDSNAALISWKTARGYYKDDADRIRCALHAIGVLRATGKNAAALALTREQMKAFPLAPAAGRLKAIELELAPPPSPSPSPAAPGTAPQKAIR